ncbi:hypothetical protein ACNKHQ_22590 [Shigella flexneri]
MKKRKRAIGRVTPPVKSCPRRPRTARPSSEQQKQTGIDLLPVGDFARYDHVLTTSLLLGNVPARHQNKDGSVDIDTLFRIRRGRAPTGEPAAGRIDQMV